MIYNCGILILLVASSITILILTLTILFKNNNTLKEIIIKNILNIPVPLCVINTNNIVYTYNDHFKNLFMDYTDNFDNFNISNLFNNIDDYISIKQECKDKNKSERIIKFIKNNNQIIAKTKLSKVTILNRSYYIFMFSNITNLINSFKFLGIFSALVDISPDGVIITRYINDKIAPKILYTNDSLHRITGYNKEELDGKPLTALFELNVNDETLKNIIYNINRLEKTTIEYQYINRKGEIYWIQSDIMPIKKSDIKTSILSNITTTENTDINETINEDIEIYITIHQKNITEDINNKILFSKNIEEINEVTIKKNNINNILSNILSTITKDKFNLLLKTITKELNVDRTFIFNVYTKDNTQYFNYNSEYTSERIKSNFNNPLLKNNTFEDMKAFELYTNLINNNITKIYVDETKDDYLMNFLAEENIKSEIIAPIFNKNKILVGFIGMDDCTNERIWTKDEEKLLKIIASHIIF